MAAMDIDVAKSIVKQFYPKALDPALEDILTLSKGSDYRPYFTAAFFIWAEYRQLIRADEVSFAYDKIYAVKGLLAIQRPIDIGLTDIPPGFTVDNLLAQLPDANTYEPGAFMVSGMSDTCDPLTNAFQNWALL